MLHYTCVIHIYIYIYKYLIHLSNRLKKYAMLNKTECLGRLSRWITHFWGHKSNNVYRFNKGRKEMFYLTTHSTHFLPLYGVTHMVNDHSDSERETRCRHIGYSFRLAARVLLYASSHRQDNTYHSLCYTSRGALDGTSKDSINVIDITSYVY